MPPSIPLSLPAGAENRQHAAAVKKAAISPAPNIRQRSNANSTTNKTTIPHRGARRVRKKPEISSRISFSESPSERITGSAPETQHNELPLYASPNATGMMGGGMNYGGVYGSPYYGAPMMMGPFSGIHQVLFGVQNVVFSLTQAVQLLVTNQHAIQQAFDSLTGMMDHMVSTFHEMRALEAMERGSETKEQQRRRRRLKALRWALTMSASWLLYKIIRRLTSRRRRLGYGEATGYPAITPRSPYSTGYNPMMYGGGHGSGFPFGSMFGGGQVGGHPAGSGTYF